MAQYVCLNIIVSRPPDSEFRSVYVGLSSRQGGLKSHSLVDLDPISIPGLSNDEMELRRRVFCEVVHISPVACSTTEIAPV